MDALGRGYRVLGFEDAAGGDEVFRHLVLARIIEPTGKLDSLRVLDEAGVAPVSYRTLKRRPPAYAEEGWRQRLSEACGADVFASQHVHDRDRRPGSGWLASRISPGGGKIPAVR